MSDEEKNENEKSQEQTSQSLPDEPIQASHSVKIKGKNLKYTTTTGMLPIKNRSSGEHEANMFFTAYTLDGVKDVTKRPLIFVFNGGPGSSSVWLHLGALGPKRVKMEDEGWMPVPPYGLVDNDYTWLDLADLVFIDPVGTGYSRAVKAEDNKKYWNLDADLKSVAEFIRLYLTRYQRWSSPLFLAGESYGTTRAAGLSSQLIDMGIALNGIMLISVVLNFQTLLFGRGNDLPNHVYVPTFAATAWYHGKLSKELQEKSVYDLVEEATEWAENEYVVALAKGDRISDRERGRIATRLARYTGLSRDYILRSNLRVHIWRFCAELRRDENITVGRLDSRYSVEQPVAVSEGMEFDPSMTAIVPPYTAAFNNYVRSELNYENDTYYEILSFEVNQNWEWERGEFPDTSEHLRKALAKNPHMKVYVGMGLYDLATPILGAKYNMSHMDANTQDRVQYATYEAGHMYYLQISSLTQLKDDIVTFMDSALAD